MKQALAFVLAGTAIGTCAATLAEAAPVPAHGILLEARPTGADAPSGALTVSDDGEEGGWFWANGGGSGSDDGNGGGSDSDDCSEDDDPACVNGAAGNAAPAGTVAPPKNGLFTEGTAPQVKSH